MKEKEAKRTGVRKQTIVVKNFETIRGHPDDGDWLLITDNNGARYRIEAPVACCLGELTPGTRLQLTIKPQIIGAKVLNPEKSP